MDKEKLIGMPLRYAKSVLEAEHIPYSIERTGSSSRFFVCNEQEEYVIRVIEAAGELCLLVNYSLEQSDSVRQALTGR